VELPPAVVGDTAERDVPLENDLVSAVFSNRGGVLKSWKLKRFRDPSGQYHDLVPQGLLADLPRPFSLRVDDVSLSRRLNSALLKVGAAAGRAIHFEYQDASGLMATKEFRIDPNSYVVSVTIAVINAGKELNPAIVWGPALGPLSKAGDATNRYAQRSQGIVYLNGGINRLNTAALAKQPTYAGPIGFGGVDDQYFLAAFVRPGAAKIDYRPVEVPVSGGNNQPPDVLVSFEAQLDRPRWPQRVFIGPKDFDMLKAVDPDLVRAVNFGRFAWLVVPLLSSLKWLNGYIGNYGWSIIALTVLINAAMFPLRHKSVVSMRKLQEIQPEVKSIQDRYAKLKATDPAKQKMNTEVMNLYRERGVNPASGCIPMLLTMPVLFAFYSMLSVAVELRGAPFMGWITDLSARDPFYVTPVLMGITMFVQMQMTPSTVDPVQQKMMMIMPIVFTFMFLPAPSGLVLYWLVSNLWAIGQQKITNQLIGPPVVRTVRPPAERRLKRAGSGKTTAADKSE
jgi:YidC/Oxa1 family membrane protein insertase